MTVKPTLETFQLETSIPLDACDHWPKPAMHQFDRKQAIAILAARAIKRPLLVRGEPGCGKTQLARAAAQVLKMPLVSLVVNERTEAEDLLWKYDALRRLSDANDPGRAVDNVKEYLSAGPLWWAMDHELAETYKGKQSCKPELYAGDEARKRAFSNGVLLLIDEIDKADRSVPNSLLEALGNYSFSVPYINDKVSCSEGDTAPLIIITSNNEQELPPAFLRRCLVLDIVLPEREEDFIKVLAARGKALFEGEGKSFPFADPKIYTTIAQQLWNKRQNLSQAANVLPGQAEYLDHLEAIRELKLIDPHRPEQELVDELAELTYNKSRS